MAILWPFMGTMYLNHKFKSFRKLICFRLVQFVNQYHCCKSVNQYLCVVRQSMYHFWNTSFLSKSVAGRPLCGHYWVTLGPTESPQARAGRTVVVPETKEIEKQQCFQILVAKPFRAKT